MLCEFELPQTPIVCNRFARAQPFVCSMKTNSCHSLHDGKSRNKPGQAPALSVRQWGLWLKWLLKTAGPRIYLAIFLTGSLGLRCSEALALRREDLILNTDVPKVRITGETAGAKKSPGDVYVRKQHIHLLKTYIKNGISVERDRKHKHGKGRKKQFHGSTPSTFQRLATSLRHVRMPHGHTCITMQSMIMFDGKLHYFTNIFRRPESRWTQ